MDCNNLKQCIDSLKKNGRKPRSCVLTCLLSYDSRRNVVVEENKNKYKLLNPNNDKVARFQVDRGMISSQDIIRCDNLVIDTDSKLAVFVELKGTDLKHVLEQIDATVTRLSPEIPDYRSFARIVTSGRTNVPNIKSCPQYVALSKKILKCGGNVNIHSNIISDNLVCM